MFFEESNNHNNNSYWYIVIQWCRLWLDTEEVCTEISNLQVVVKSIVLILMYLKALGINRKYLLLLSKVLNEIGLINAYIRVQNFATKPCFCTVIIIFQRLRTFTYLTWEFVWFTLLWEFPEVILHRVICQKWGLVVKWDTS